MQCGKCGSEAETGARFCSQCGESLVAECTNCQASLAPDAKFCSQCGTAVAAQEKAPKPTAERRQISTLFCDLVGSTPLAERLDAEDWRDVLNRYQEACVGAVEEFQGYLAQYLGDGLLCYFGYPTASEHDAENAVRAGLAMIERVRRLLIKIDGERIDLSVRVGIHTGPVVVGEIGAGARRETLALGATTNLAARLQSAAEINTVLISADTERLIHRRLPAEPLGAQTFAGVSEPVEVFEVRADSQASAPMGVDLAELSPFTGRAADMALLMDRAQRAFSGRGQVVLLSGEPGIGKSRMVRSLREQLDADSVDWLECRAEHFAHQKILRPVIDLIERNLGLVGLAEDVRRDALKHGLDLAGVTDPAVQTLVSQLLDLATEEAVQALGLDASEARARLLDGLVAWVVALSRQRPVVLAVEDLQWLDSNSRAWLDALVHASVNECLLVFVTQRPQALPNWNDARQVLTLTVGPLDHSEARDLVGALLRDHAMTDAEVDELLTRTDGNPLFIEELVAAMASGAGPAANIPATLQDSLMARLDSVGAAKVTAQLGACFGREFDLTELSTVSELEVGEVRRHIDVLQDHGLLYRRRSYDRTFVFRHGLMRDTAYDSMMRSTRRALHARIAGVLNEAFPERAAAHPELLAHHHTLAEEHRAATTQLVRAAENERDRFGYAEAVGYFESALESLERVEEAPDHHAQELQIRMSLGRLVTAIAGYGAAPVEANALRIRDLCDQLGESPQIFPALFEQWSLALGHEDGASMEGFGQRLLRLATQLGDRSLLVETELAMAVTHMFQGRPAECIEHANRSVDLYDFEQDKTHVTTFGQDPSMMAQAIGGLSHAVCGNLDQAAAWAERSMEAALRVEHPYSETCANAFQASVRNLRGEWEVALSCAQAQLELSKEHGFALYEAGASGFRAGALLGLGRLEEAAQAARVSADGYLACNSQPGSLTPLITLATAQLRLGDLSACGKALEEAEALIDRKVGPYNWPGLMSLRALYDLAVTPEQTEAPYARFRLALDIADEQRAKLSALLVATRYASALAARGNDKEAHAVLMPRLEAIQEGKDCAPVVAARTLAAQLPAVV